MTDLLWMFAVAVVLGLAIGFLRPRRVTIIYPPNVGLLYRNGKFERELGPGRYAFFDPLKRTHLVKVSRAPLPVPLGEITVLSKDQFSFKLALSPVVEVTDARAFTESQPAVEPTPYANLFPTGATHPALHTLVASAALETVATQSLRDLFADPKLLPNAVQAKLADAIPGARIPAVLMTSITLPPETRKMFTEVERSKIEAEASLERARGEQAALRALANAARLIKDNPALANLRFLQTLEQTPGPKTIVLGSDAMLPLTGGAQGRATQDASRSAS
jgi:regulator of protease activity HflC (stomatin/prohibitin superfamily)